MHLAGNPDSSSNLKISSGHALADWTTREPAGGELSRETRDGATVGAQLMAQGDAVAGCRECLATNKELLVA
jgi:hypothetical protein